LVACRLRVQGTIGIGAVFEHPADHGVCAATSRRYRVRT
jgi:hypothetical protein